MANEIKRVSGQRLASFAQHIRDNEDCLETLLVRISTKYYVEFCKEKATQLDRERIAAKQNVLNDVKADISRALAEMAQLNPNELYE